MQHTVSSGPRLSAVGSEPLPRARSFADAKLRDRAAANYLTHKRTQRRNAIGTAAYTAAFYTCALLLLAIGSYCMRQTDHTAFGLYCALSGLACVALLTFDKPNR